MKIAIFLQGTLIMHRGAAGKTREEIIRQVIDKENSVRDFANYVPIGDAVNKLKKWSAQGTEIVYLSALTEDKKGRGDEVVGKEGLKAEEENLRKLGFPSTFIFHRASGETYADMVEKIKPLPDILIEDDCESIGGEKEMTYPNLRPGLQNKIKSIVVREFEGIDHLPVATSALLVFK